MASGLQCPGCGHVHPAGLPEIARGDATFRCYGCYRMLSVPEGWTGRPAPRPPAPALTPTGDAPAGAGTRDARTARLAGRGRLRDGASTGPPAGDPTQMVPAASAGTPATGAAFAGSGAGVTVNRGRATAASGVASPLGWVATRRSGRPLPGALRALVWVGAFAAGLLITAFVLRKLHVLSVNTALDVYAGTGLRRFGILLVVLPLWAILSATIAHFSLEGLARRRRPRRPAAPPGDAPAPR
jgi:hypothetical protein